MRNACIHDLVWSLYPSQNFFVRRRTSEFNLITATNATAHLSSSQSPPSVSLLLVFSSVHSFLFFGASCLRNGLLSAHCRHIVSTLPTIVGGATSSSLSSTVFNLYLVPTDWPILFLARIRHQSNSPHCHSRHPQLNDRSNHAHTQTHTHAYSTHTHHHCLIYYIFLSRTYISSCL